MHVKSIKLGHWSISHSAPTHSQSYAAAAEHCHSILSNNSNFINKLATRFDRQHSLLPYLHRFRFANGKHIVIRNAIITCVFINRNDHQTVNVAESAVSECIFDRISMGKPILYIRVIPCSRMHTHTHTHIIDVYSKWHFCGEASGFIHIYIYIDCCVHFMCRCWINISENWYFVQFSNQQIELKYISFCIKLNVFFELPNLKYLEFKKGLEYFFQNYKMAAGLVERFPSKINVVANKIWSSIKIHCMTTYLEHLNRKYASLRGKGVWKQPKRVGSLCN